MGYEYLLQALENFVQLVNVGKDIVGLALGFVDHLLISLTRKDEHGDGARVLRNGNVGIQSCLLYTSPSPRDRQKSRMPSSA